MQKSLLKSFFAVPLVSALCVGGWFFCSTNSIPGSEMIQGALANVAPPQKIIAYGLEFTGMDLSFEKVKSGQNFAGMLKEKGLEFNYIQKVINASKGVFNPGKICSGKKFCLVRDCENNNAITHMIYEEDLTNFVVFKLDETPIVNRGEKPVVIEKKTASGIIEGSLWDALVGQDLPYELAMKMADIYAWEIDFFRLQKGDQFTVEYDESFVEGKSSGVNAIHSARFYHENEDHFAFYFEQEGKGEYYDSQGNSLRKSFLSAPLKFSRISSGFTNKRFHPILKKFTAHPGIDYAAPTGTPIHAVGDGVILEAQFKGGNGNYVKIKHNQTYSTQYLHMSKFGAGIRAGAHVKQGQVIGYVGSTGLSTGPHLCYRFWKNGVQVNPLKEKFPSAGPVKKEHRDAFEAYMKEHKTRLGKMNTDKGAEANDAI